MDNKKVDDAKSDQDTYLPNPHRLWRTAGPQETMQFNRIALSLGIIALMALFRLQLIDGVAQLVMSLMR